VSPAARTLTAQVLHVCGGRSLYGGPADVPTATPMGTTTTTAETRGDPR
jgi:hypothetical protein